MSHVFSVSPDFSPRYAPSWFVFNTWLQRALERPFHLTLFDSAAAQREAIGRDEIDLIYANPFDASLLLRDRGFQAVAAPAGRSDEALIAVRHDSPIQKVRDLRPGLKVATTADVDVRTLCMILLEPADLDATNIELCTRDSYVLVAKDLLGGEVDAGFFLGGAFDELSPGVRAQMRPLTRSLIHVIRHSMLLSPRLAELREALAAQLTDMVNDEKGLGILRDLGMASWERLEQEDIEFMIDLMDTLVARPA